MKNTMKRLFSLLMVLVLLGSMLPAVYADNSANAEPADNPIVLTDADYAIVNDVFAQIDAMEDAPTKKNASETQLTDEAIGIVMASENYVEGSLERNGNSFTWWTDEGIRCVYSPRMRQIQDDMVAPENPIADGAYNEPVATKGGWPSGNQVYLIGPYYGVDSNFSDQYKNEAKAIASAIGDTDGYTLYSGTKATVDKVAEAVSNGAVVIFDSHGTTDYESGDDYVTGATSSYLCLTSTTGLTSEDYNDGALYYSDGICINGATIANHMTKNSPAGIVWMAICLGMATDSFATPFREKGVEVVYGYSQSVTFDGDYLWEEIFWDNMCAGANVASAVADMKSKCGEWDYCSKMYSYAGWRADEYGPITTISEARRYYYAFPIVVSDEDTHPGQRKGSNYGADSLQTVKSTYTLFSQYDVTAKSNNAAYGTVSVSGNTITAVPAAGYFAQSATVISGNATVTQNGNTFSVNAQSDCTVQINFAAKTAVTVNFSGANVSGQTGYAGDSMNLPTAQAPEGYTFLGWTTAPLSSETTEKPSYYTDSFIPTGNTTLYALYSYVDENSGSGTGDYVKVTSTPADWSGEYVIVYEADGYIFDGSRTTLEATSNYKTVTITDNTIAAEDADPYKFVIAPMDGGYSIKSESNKYIGGQSGSNKLVEGSTAMLNTIALDAEGNATIISNTSHLRFNTTSGQYRFRYYKASTYSSQKAIALYIKDGSAGTTYYTGNPVKCEHNNTSELTAVAATCTENGYTAGIQCDDCGNIISGREVVAALGHSWSNWNASVAPGCETAGEENRICGNCGETETQSVPATGHSFGGWVVTTAPTCTAEGVKTSTCGTCGATKTESVPVIDHSYENGICTGCGAAEPTAPTTLENGDQVVIFAPAYNKALSADKVTAESFYNKGVDVTVANGVVSGYGDAEIWTVIKNADGTYSFANSGQNIGLAEEFSSMNLGAIYDDWTLISLGGSLYNIRNVGRNSFIEWYSSKDNWSTYNSTSAATDDQYQLSFYIIGEGILGDETEEPEVTEPEETAPAGSVTTLQYVFSDYTAGTQYAEGENHTLDDVITLTINGAHLNSQIRLYAGSNAVFTSTKVIDSIVVKAGYKADTLNVYGSTDGTTWTLIKAQATTATYTEYSFDMPAAYTYVKLESVGAQIRVSEMTIKVLESGTTEPDVTEPEVTEPEETAPAGSVTTLQYVFSDYTAGTQYAEGENHPLDDVITLTINGAHLNSQIRLYAGSNAVFTSTKVIDSIVVKAGYKADTLSVYGSTDGTTWTLIKAQATTTTYTEYSFDMPAAYTYLKLESVGAQIRVSEMTINVVEPGATVTNQVNAWGMVLGDDLNVIFNVNMAEDSQLVITVADQTYTFNANVTTDGSYDAYVPLAAAQMADEIVVKFVTGQEESESSVYTVKEYADYILTDVNNEFTDEDKALVQAMLNYGGAAQTYFGYNTENLVSTEFGEVVPEGAEEMVVADTAADITFYGASLVYRERIAVRFYFTGDVAGKLFTVQGKEVEAMQKDGLYYVEIGDIMPYELDQQFTVTSDGISVTYGPMNYIVRMYEKGGESLQNLMQALYNYHVTALEYVTA